jgi:uroporphyrin-III C-methyltransferase/precorrin-2 dehydrogenase/sirohydrochlorin ferrochelatase
VSSADRAIVALALSGRRAVVIGAGPVGLRRARELVEAGADVVVVADHVGADGVGPAPDASSILSKVELRRRRFRPWDLDDAWLVVSATGDPESEAEVARAAGERGCWWVSASEEGCGMSVLARRDVADDTWVAVGTSGGSPALASWLAERLDERLRGGPPEGQRLRADPDGPLGEPTL